MNKTAEGALRSALAEAEQMVSMYEKTVTDAQARLEEVSGYLTDYKRRTAELHEALARTPATTE